jgi:hypothetical protein
MKEIELVPELKLDAILKQLDGDDIVLTRQGHAIALLSEFDDDELYWYKREHDPTFIASIAEAREQAAQGKTITHKELKKRLGID